MRITPNVSFHEKKITFGKARKKELRFTPKRVDFQPLESKKTNIADRNFNLTSEIQYPIAKTSFNFFDMKIDEITGFSIFLNDVEFDPTNNR